jgi:hypothetical protein
MRTSLVPTLLSISRLKAGMRRCLPLPHNVLEERLGG